VGFLSNYLYQYSVTLRGDYWRAGLAMFRDHPLFGIGLDEYGNWYQQYRSVEAFGRSGPGGVSDAAHNVFIDFLASGGLLLFVPYVLLVSLITWRGLNWITKNTNNSDIIFVFTLWVGYIAQSVISINSIPVAVWGWTAGGTLLGLSASKSIKVKVRKSNYLLDPRTHMFRFVAGLLGIVLILPLTLKDYNFYRAIKLRNDALLIKSVESFPRNSTYEVLAASILSRNGDYGGALRIAQLNIGHNPRSYSAWLQIYENPLTSIDEKSIAHRQLLKLDPNNKIE